jgi:hypothetical protein
VFSTPTDLMHNRGLISHAATYAEDAGAGPPIGRASLRSTVVSNMRFDGGVSMFDTRGRKRWSGRSSSGSEPEDQALHRAPISQAALTIGAHVLPRFA